MLGNIYGLQFIFSDKFYLKIFYFMVLDLLRYVSNSSKRSQNLPEGFERSLTNYITQRIPKNNKRTLRYQINVKQIL